MKCRDVDAWVLGEDHGRTAAGRARRHLRACTRCAVEHADVERMLDLAASPRLGRGMRLVTAAIAPSLLALVLLFTQRIEEPRSRVEPPTPPVAVPEGRRREVVVDGPGVIAWSGARAQASPPSRIVYTFTSERFASSR